MNDSIWFEILSRASPNKPVSLDDLMNDDQSPQPFLDVLVGVERCLHERDEPNDPHEETDEERNRRVDQPRHEEPFRGGE